MQHSYNYTKKFIENQVNILNEPLTITSEIRSMLDESLTEHQLQQVLYKLNNDIKHNNERLFPPQINNQIILQIMKLETQKLKIVNQQLFKLNAFVKPIILPDFEILSNSDQHEKLVDFTNLIDELPKLKYLFVSNDGATNIEEEYSLEEDDDKGNEDADINVDNEHTIQDDQDKTVSRKEANKEFIEDIIDEVNGLNEHPEPELLENYDKLRESLIEISKKLKYKNDKLNYLRKLQQNINHLFSSDQSQTTSKTNELYDSDEEVTETPDINDLQKNLQFKESVTETRSLASELNRFRILVEQISYKANSKNIAGEELREKLQQLND